MTKAQRALLRRLCERPLTALDLTDTEIDTLATLVDKDLVIDHGVHLNEDLRVVRTPTHLRIWSIKQSGRMAL